MSEAEYLLLKQYKDLGYIPLDKYRKLDTVMKCSLMKSNLLQNLGLSSSPLITPFANSQIEEYERKLVEFKLLEENTTTAKEALKEAKIANKKSKIANFLSLFAIIFSVASAILIALFT